MDMSPPNRSLDESSINDQWLQYLACGSCLHGGSWPQYTCVCHSASESPPKKDKKTTQRNLIQNHIDWLGMVYTRKQFDSSLQSALSNVLLLLLVIISIIIVSC